MTFSLRVFKIKKIKKRIRKNSYVPQVPQIAKNAWGCTARKSLILLSLYSPAAPDLDWAEGLLTFT